eukprot:11221702-Lingulodinium_polyedra.AAC.1
MKCGVIEWSGACGRKVGHGKGNQEYETILKTLVVGMIQNSSSSDAAASQAPNGRDAIARVSGDER